MKKREFLRLRLEERHRYCSSLVHSFYSSISKGNRPNGEEIERYHLYLSWMGEEGLKELSLESLSERYHRHVQREGRALKEERFLSSRGEGKREKPSPWLPVTLYLDDLRSPYNVGHILRICEAFRIGPIIASPLTPTHQDPKVKHVALEAWEAVPFHPFYSWEELPSPLIALETGEEAQSLFTFSFPPSFTLILGNEERGVSHELLKKVEAKVKIPSFGIQESLNVTAAFAIAAARVREVLEVQRTLPSPEGRKGH